MNSDTRYLKRHANLSDLPLRSRARVFAAGPSGCKLQRAALAWLKRKCQACGRAASSQSSEHDASLARKAAAL
jgi:hypothetical protein